MKARNKKALALLLGLSLAVGSLAGCGNNEAEEPENENNEANEGTEDEGKENEGEDEGTDEVVEITWHRTAWHTNEDEQAVEDAINAYIEPKIGVRVKTLNDAANPPLDTMMAGGDDVDLCWVASWSNLYTFTSDGAAYDITDLVKNYPDLYASMPENIWEAAKLNGKNLYIPIYKETANATGLSVPTAAVEKYGWDLSSVKTLADIEPMLEEAKADGMEYAFAVQQSYFDSWGLDTFSFMGVPYLAVRRDDPSKVVNVMESEEYKAHVELMYKWNQAGYINQTETDDTAISDAIITDLRKNNNNAFYRWTMIPDSKAAASTRYGADTEVVQLTKAYMETDSPAGSAYMINAKSDEATVDACLKFVELLFTDQTLANLACFGIEGEHYNLDADGKVELIADSGYAYPGVYIVTNVKAPTLLAGEADNKLELYDEFNEAAEISCLNGFRFDSSNVAAEYDALNGVIAEYRPLLERGFYNPEEYLPQFQQALKDAGVDKVIAEAQSQLEAWSAAN